MVTVAPFLTFGTEIAFDPVLAVTVLDPPPDTDTTIFTGVQTLVFLPFTTLEMHVFESVDGTLTVTFAVVPVSFATAEETVLTEVGDVEAATALSFTDFHTEALPARSKTRTSRMSASVEIAIECCNALGVEELTKTPGLAAEERSSNLAMPEFASDALTVRRFLTKAITLTPSPTPDPLVTSSSIGAVSSRMMSSVYVDERLPSANTNFA